MSAEQFASSGLPAIDLAERVLWQPAEQVVSFTDLYPQSTLRGRRSSELPPFEQTRLAVERLLHVAIPLGEVAIASDDVKGQYGIPEVASTTARVVDLWETIWWKNGITSAFADLPMEEHVTADLSRRDVRLVVGVANAICRVFDMAYPGNTLQKAATQLVARRGADYALRWVAGNLTSTAIAGDITFSRFNLIDMAAKYPRDPMARATEIARNIRGLTPAAISEQLNMPMDEVAELFPRDTVYALAERANPLEYLTDCYAVLVDDLTPEKIARELGLVINDAASLFDKHFLLKMVMDNTNQDYMARLRQIHIARTETLTHENLTRLLGLSLPTVEYLFPPWVINFCARYKDPVAKVQSVTRVAMEAQRTFGLPVKAVMFAALTYSPTRKASKFSDVMDILQVAYANPPPRIDRAAYLWATVRAPFDLEKRDEVAVYYQLFLDARSSDDNSKQSKRLSYVPLLSNDDQPFETTDLSTFDPAELLYGDVSPDILILRLCKSAGITAAELAPVLRYFQGKGDMTRQVSATITKLSGAAEAESRE